jgi:hypothetical protein
MQLRALAVLTLAMSGVACTPPCEPVTSTLTSVCHRADAGAIAPDASFILEGQSGSFGACDVSIDGGAISLSVTGGPLGSCFGGASGARAPAGPVRCTVPPLAAGTYTVNSQPAVSFTIPGDAGVPPCF